MHMYDLKKYSLIWYITFPKQKYCYVLIMQYVCHVVNSDYTSNLCIYLVLSRRIYSQSGSMHIFHFFCFVCLHKQNCTHQTTVVWYYVRLLYSLVEQSRVPCCAHFCWCILWMLREKFVINLTYDEAKETWFDFLLCSILEVWMKGCPRSSFPSPPSV